MTDLRLHRITLNGVLFMEESPNVFEGPANGVRFRVTLSDASPAWVLESLDIDVPYREEGDKGSVLGKALQRACYASELLQVGQPLRAAFDYSDYVACYSTVNNDEALDAHLAAEGTMSQELFDEKLTAILEEGHLPHEEQESLIRQQFDFPIRDLALAYHKYERRAGRDEVIRNGH